MNRILYIFGLFFLLTACTEKAMYESFLPIENAEWNYSDLKTFEVELDQNQEKGYKLNLLFRHNSEYVWRNLNIRIHTIYPDGTKKTTIEEIPFADNKGNWFGSGKGDIILNEIILQEKALIEQSGKYIFQVEQFMRYEPLEGIMDVGMSVSEITE